MLRLMKTCAVAACLALLAAPAMAQTKWYLPAAYPADNPHSVNLFVLQTMSGKDSNTVAKAALPFFFLLVVAVAIITVFPDIVMVLPRIAFPG